MKIISWNVNGMEACKRKCFMNFLQNTDPDIFCCQEIKKQCYLNTPEYLQFWNPAERPGYSGTLLLSKREPLSIRSPGMPLFFPTSAPSLSPLCFAAISMWREVI